MDGITSTLEEESFVEVFERRFVVLKSVGSLGLCFNLLKKKNLGYLEYEDRV